MSGVFAFMEVLTYIRDMVSEQVKDIQSALAIKGFEPGPADGKIGKKTKSAICAFKESVGLWPMPFVGPETLACLFDRMPLEPFNSSDAPEWLEVAMGHVGLAEVPGSVHNPQIVKWWSELDLPFTDDETPWCAAFVGGVLQECGLKSTKSAMARSYEKWGNEVQGPAVGCVVVFWRGAPEASTGHVGFVAGRDEFGNLMVAGGNQGNRVSVKPFDTERVLSYRWPDSVQMPEVYGFSNLPTVGSDGKVSTNEQ